MVVWLVEVRVRVRVAAVLLVRVLVQALLSGGDLTQDYMVSTDGPGGGGRGKDMGHVHSV